MPSFISWTSKGRNRSIVVKPDLIIGYMRDLGKARGYKPEL